MGYPSFANSWSWRNARSLIKWITSRMCINFDFSNHHIHVSAFTMSRFKASSTCFFPTQKRCSRRWTTSTRLGKIKVFWTIWALRWVTHQNLKEVVPLTWCIMQKYRWKPWLKSTYLVSESSVYIPFFSIITSCFLRNVKRKQMYQKVWWHKMAKQIIFIESSNSASKSLKRIFRPQTFDSKHTLIRRCVV